VKLLVVDDSSTMRRIIKNTLGRLGHKDVLEAEHGLELVQKVRAEEKYVDMPIIMVTTEGGKTEVITALKAGVNNYIVKPFTPQVLKEKLEDVLS